MPDRWTQATEDALTQMLAADVDDADLLHDPCRTVARAVLDWAAHRGLLVEPGDERHQAVIDAELLGIGRVFNALDSYATAAVLREHQRMDIGHCRCGWGVNSGDIGKPHSEHVLAAISSAVREAVYLPEAQP